MKTLFCKLAIAAIALGFALPVVARAQTGDNDGCTNATLKGDYAFTIQGQTFLPANPSSVATELP